MDAVSVSLVFLRSAEPLENISRCVSHRDCPPRVTDVSRESGKDGSAGCASPHGLEEARDEMSLVRVMDGGDVELELLRQADQTVRLRWRSGAGLKREGDDSSLTRQSRWLRTGWRRTVSVTAPLARSGDKAGRTQ